MINDTLIPYGFFLKVYVIQKKIRILNLADQQKCTTKTESTSCVSKQFNGMHVVRALNENSRRKDFTPLYIFIDCPVSKKYCDNYYFSSNPKSAFVAHYDQRNKFNKHIKRCTGRPGFVYCFQNESLETYEKYLQHKKDFPFTVVRDLETTAGYISEIEGGAILRLLTASRSIFTLK